MVRLAAVLLVVSLALSIAYRFLLIEQACQPQSIPECFKNRFERQIPVLRLLCIPDAT